MKVRITLLPVIYFLLTISISFIACEEKPRTIRPKAQISKQKRQPPCGFDDSLSSNDIAKFRQAFSSSTLDTSAYTIKVIFHVVSWDQDDIEENISGDRIRRELADLNLDFLMQNPDINSVYANYKGRIGNPRINFELADTTFTNGGAPEQGILRVERTSGDELFRSSATISPERYLNVYIGHIESDGYVESVAAWEEPASDGIYLNCYEVGYNTRLLSHEAGHWLGLYHSFEGWCSSSYGDGIDDTPPQWGPWSWYVACDPNNDYYQCYYKEFPMYNNYMDYTSCRSMFTRDQVKVMRHNLKTYRPATIASNLGSTPM